MMYVSLKLGLIFWTSFVERFVSFFKACVLKQGLSIIFYLHFSSDLPHAEHQTKPCLTLTLTIDPISISCQRRMLWLSKVWD
uniref:Uncharacterized protein n=2 Tax=Brassica oleracea TaxID=3712 RepID=A0A0D3AEB3_BRAOL|nr:unnamed protein product [Brassica oleracea]